MNPKITATVGTDWRSENARKSDFVLIYERFLLFSVSSFFLSPLLSSKCNVSANYRGALAVGVVSSAVKESLGGRERCCQGKWSMFIKKFRFMN